MKITILIMDDDYITRLLLEKTLGKKFEVVLKENGLEGIKWIEQGNIPDLVITDNYMPEINGFKFLEYIRKKESLRNIPVIMFSAMDTDEILSISAGFEANDYISKPLNIEQLNISIENLLHHYTE